MGESHRTTSHAAAEAEHVATAPYDANVPDNQNDMTSAVQSGPMHPDSQILSTPAFQRSDVQGRHQSMVGTLPSSSASKNRSRNRSKSPSRALAGLIEQVENKSQLVIQCFGSFSETREAVKQEFSDHVVEGFLVAPRSSTAGEDVEADPPVGQYVPYGQMETAISKVDEESERLQHVIQDLLERVGELSGMALSLSPEVTESRNWPKRDENWSRDLSSILFPEPLPDGVRYAEDFRTIVAALEEMSPRGDAEPVASTPGSDAEYEHPHVRRLIDLHIARGEVQDRLMSSFESEADDGVSRDLMRDQGQILTTTDKAFRKRFSRARARLNRQIERLNAQIQEQEAVCLANGLDPFLLVQQCQLDDVLVDDTFERSSRSASSEGNLNSDMNAKVEAWRDGFMSLS